MRTTPALQETTTLGHKVNSLFQLCVVINKRGHNGKQPELAREGFPKEVAPRYIRGTGRSQPAEEWTSSKSSTTCKGKKQQVSVKVVQYGKRTGSPGGLVCSKWWR